MKFAILILVFALGVGTLPAQDRLRPEKPAPMDLGTSPSARETGAPASNDKAAPPRALASAMNPADTFTIQPSQRAAAKPSGSGMNLWEMFQKGGWAMYVLAGLSVITVMLVLVYTFTLRRSAILTPHYMNTADVLLKKKDYLGLLAISSRHSELVARIVQRTLDFATKNPGVTMETLKEIAETEGSARSATLQHRATFLADIGVLAPMIGLLGTVGGIISAFGELGRGDASLSRDIGMASGVSQALVATMAGLVLGIIAMGFYALFRNRVQSLISDLEVATAHIIGLLSMNFGKKRERSRVAVEDEF